MQNLTIGFSDIEGIGLFSRKRFQKGEEVLTISGSILDERQYGDWLFRFNPQKPFGMQWVQISEHAYVDPSNIGKYTNHSCEPNCGIKRRSTLIALRTIYPGEEIKYDYAMTDWDYFSFACNCQESRCRDTVRGYRYLPFETRERYRGVILPYLERLKNTE